VSACTSLWSRTQHSRFTEALRAAIMDLHVPGEPCVHEGIRWILDHIDAYLLDSPEHGWNARKQVATYDAPVSFTRLWIYSHHIYNTTKRKTIIETARELDLSGFSVVGKPGIVCVEGVRASIENFWSRIRAMQWQRICVRHREDISGTETQPLTVDELRRLKTSKLCHHFWNRVWGHPSKTS